MPQPGEHNWLISARWVIGSGVALIGLLGERAGFLASAWPLLVVAGGLHLSNLIWWLLLRADRKAGRQSPSRHVLLQLFFDLVALVATLHFAGGTENPFVAAFAVHVAIGAVYLSGAQAWTLAVSAGLVYTLAAISENRGLLSPSWLRFSGTEHLLTPHDLSHLVLHLSAFWLMLAGVVLCVRIVRGRQKAAEQREQHNARIAEARERLARVGEISAGLAHTIRNPLHGALNVAAIVEQDLSADAPSRELLPLLREALERIDRITRRLLSATRDEPAPKVEMPIAELLRDAVSFAEVTASKAKVKLRIEASEPAPAVIVDADRISEALINVIDNAIAVSPPGGEVRIVAKAVAGGARIEVIDSGPGIAPELESRVFDPFFSTKAVGEGSGLGLAIARRAMEHHGGSIRLANREQGGVCVTFELPAEPPARDEGGPR